MPLINLESLDKNTGAVDPKGREQRCLLPNPEKWSNVEEMGLSMKKRYSYYLPWLKMYVHKVTRKQINVCFWFILPLAWRYILIIIIMWIHTLSYYMQSLYFFLILIFYFTLQYCIGFGIYWHESATGVHELPNMNPPPTSHPVSSLQIIPVHQPQASCILHRT